MNRKCRNKEEQIHAEMQKKKKKKKKKNVFIILIFVVYKFIWIISGLHVNNKRINNNIHTKIVMALTSCDNTVITYRWKKKRADALH